MKTRVITGIILAAIIVPIVYFGGIYFLIFGLLMSIIAAHEMMEMFYTKRKSLKNLRYVIPILTGLITLMVYLVNVKNVDQFWLVVIFLSCIIFAMGVVVFTKDSHADDMLSCIMTLVYCGLIIGYVISVRYIGESFPISFQNIIFKNIPNTIKTDFSGPRLFAYLYLIVIGTDISAYFFGSRFGKRKLAPTISPNKSVEGAIWGLIMGSAVGTAFAFLFNLISVSDFHSALLAGLVVFLISAIMSFMVQLGDLIASKLKRAYDIKDFGYIFPGHGGVLDRFDSLIFSGAFFYIIIQFIQLIIFK